MSLKGSNASVHSIFLGKNHPGNLENMLKMYRENWRKHVMTGKQKNIFIYSETSLNESFIYKLRPPNKGGVPVDFSSGGFSYAGRSNEFEIFAIAHNWVKNIKKQLC